MHTLLKSKRPLTLLPFILLLVNHQMSIFCAWDQILQMSSHLSLIKMRFEPRYVFLLNEELAISKMHNNTTNATVISL